MVTLQISLPADMLIFVESQTTARGYADPSEYLRSLIAAAQKEQEQIELDARFADAIRAMERGEPNPLSPEDWRSLQQRVLNRRSTTASGQS